MPDPSGITEPKLLIVEGHSAEIFFTALLSEIDLTNIQVRRPGDITDMDELWGFLRALRGAVDFARKIDPQGIVGDIEGDAFQSIRDALRELWDNMGLADIQVQDFGGVDQLRGFLKALKNRDEFAVVESLGIVRDAERSDPMDAFKSVCRALRGAGLTAPGQIERFEGSNPKVGVLILPDAAAKGMLETLCLRSVADDPVMPCIEKYFNCLEERLPQAELPRNMDKARVQAFLASRPEPELQLGRAAQKRYWPWDCPAFMHVREFLSQL